MFRTDRDRHDDTGEILDGETGEAIELPDRKIPRVGHGRELDFNALTDVALLWDSREGDTTALTIQPPQAAITDVEDCR